MAISICHHCYAMDPVSHRTLLEPQNDRCHSTHLCNISPDLRIYDSRASTSTRTLDSSYPPLLFNAIQYLSYRYHIFSLTAQLYKKLLKNSRQKEGSPEEERIMMEIKIFSLASHLFGVFGVSSTPNYQKIHLAIGIMQFLD